MLFKIGYIIVCAIDFVWTFFNIIFLFFKNNPRFFDIMDYHTENSNDKNQL